MKLKTPFPSYAQYNEDIILLALLHDVENGFYVDVGANYPIIDSVTKLFYQHGWRGINIEPIPALYDQLKDDRPEDVNLNIGIGEKNNKITFYENINIPGHSSFKRPDNKGAEIKEYEVSIKTLRDVFENNHVKRIHFLKVDVEGFEDEVISSNDWNKYRPEVLCIESGIKGSKYRAVIKSANYKLFIQDGINEYYLATESYYRTKGFEDRVVGLADNSLRYHQYRSWLGSSRQLKKVTKLNRIHYEEMIRLRNENTLSLKNMGYGTRLKRAIYGLTTDWFSYKRNSRKK